MKTNRVYLLGGWLYITHPGVSGWVINHKAQFLLYEAERKVGYARRLPHTRAFQLDGLDAEIFEQADALAKQDRDKVNPYFIEKAQF